MTQKSWKSVCVGKRGTTACRRPIPWETSSEGRASTRDWSTAKRGPENKCGIEATRSVFKKDQRKNQVQDVRFPGKWSRTDQQEDGKLQNFSIRTVQMNRGGILRRPSKRRGSPCFPDTDRFCNDSGTELAQDVGTDCFARTEAFLHNEAPQKDLVHIKKDGRS